MIEHIFFYRKIEVSLYSSSSKWMLENMSNNLDKASQRLTFCSIFLNFYLRSSSVLWSSISSYKMKVLICSYEVFLIYIFAVFYQSILSFYGTLFQLFFNLSFIYEILHLSVLKIVISLPFNLYHFFLLLLVSLLLRFSPNLYYSWMKQ